MGLQKNRTEIKQKQKTDKYIILYYYIRYSLFDCIYNVDKYNVRDI